MGRIKTKLIKRVTVDFYRENKDNIKKTFKENKELVSELINVPSKKLRNIIAGYVTRLKKTTDE